MTLPVPANHTDPEVYRVQASKPVSSEEEQKAAGIAKRPQTSASANLHRADYDTDRYPQAICEDASSSKNGENHNTDPYPNPWPLQRESNLNDAFDKAWVAYTTVYNGGFKTETSPGEIRQRVMAGHIHGEDVLLPRPGIEHRLTRRRQGSMNN